MTPSSIIFSSTANDRALCIIDLDTVMPGYVHYDFGDAIRTATNRADEDSADLSSVSMDIEHLQGLRRRDTCLRPETHSTTTEIEVPCLRAKTAHIYYGHKVSHRLY
ncbi:MAG: aminoglycoside phosphotransferase family protein [Marinilabiliales bacterium]|nr:aminoglycoside phosphotransferase family protein [Marinilabiliales bacterium]